MYKVYWLRICLKKIQENKKTKKLFRKNADLQVAVKPFYLSAEINALYDMYRASIDFDAPDHLPHYFLEGSTTNIFNTNIIEIRDGETLVAAGFYDIGEKSTAAIINFYHPDYKKRGLGIYLFFLEIEQSRKENKKWFYPGYVADGYSKFNYKLLPGLNAAEIYDTDGERWLPFTWDVMLTHPLG